MALAMLTASFLFGVLIAGAVEDDSVLVFDNGTFRHYESAISFQVTRDKLSIWEYLDLNESFFQGY